MSKIFQIISHILVQFLWHVWFAAWHSSLALSWHPIWVHVEVSVSVPSHLPPPPPTLIPLIFLLFLHCRFWCQHRCSWGLLLLLEKRKITLWQLRLDSLPSEHNYAHSFCKFLWRREGREGVSCSVCGIRSSTCHHHLAELMQHAAAVGCQLFAFGFLFELICVTCGSCRAAHYWHFIRRADMQPPLPPLPPVAVPHMHMHKLPQQCEAGARNFLRICYTLSAHTLITWPKT